MSKDSEDTKKDVQKPKTKKIEIIEKDEFKEIEVPVEEDEEEKTKEITKIEDVEEKLEEEKEEKEKEKKSEEKEETPVVKEKKNNNKKTITLVIILTLLIVLLVSAIIFLLPKKDDKKDNDTDKDTEEILTDKDKKEALNNYGDALEKVIAINYQTTKEILGYEDAIKLIDIKDDISCDVHEIYEDGKVYLNDCYINGIKVSYTYGEKQEPKDEEVEVDNTKTIMVYVDKKTKVATLNKPNNLDDYDTYTVETDTTYDSATLLGYGSNYVFYYDSDYNVQMKSYKTNAKALNSVNYQSIIPFKYNNSYDTKYVAVVLNDNAWGVYNLENGQAVIPAKYNFIVSNYSIGVSGPPLYIEPLDETAIIVNDGKHYGLMNYKNAKTILDFKYDSLSVSGNYLLAVAGDEKKIFDFKGNEYLAKSYDKIYGLVSGIYVLVEDKDDIKLVQMDGKVLFDYGKIENLGAFNYGFDYNGGALFIFNQEGSDMCLELTYQNGTGEIKDIVCGGIAKPILYLYPEKETKVKVSFSRPEFLETTYPKYNNGWNVLASVGGNLYDGKNNYYALYWDEKKVHTVDFSEGFYVESDEAIDFLESKLNYIGFNEKERNEFIMYWLPVLEKNGKSLVYFELTEERESYNKLIINPKPDSMLRVVIHIKKVDKKVDIKKETLTKFRRSGFTAVEWGGTTY